MKTAQQNTLYIILIVIIQTIISNFLHTGTYVTVSLLPLLLLMMPVHWPTARLLIVCVAVSLPVDIFAEGVTGMNVAALLPAAMVRDGMIRLFTTNGSREREGYISTDWMGRPRFIILVSAILIVFLSLYVTFECAGARPALFILLKTLASYAVNLVLYLILQNAALKEPKER